MLSLHLSPSRHSSPKFKCRSNLVNWQKQSRLGFFDGIWDPDFFLLSTCHTRYSIRKFSQKLWRLWRVASSGCQVLIEDQNALRVEGRHSQIVIGSKRR